MDSKQKVSLIKFTNQILGEMQNKIASYKNNLIRTRAKDDFQICFPLFIIFFYFITNNFRLSNLLSADDRQIAQLISK